VLLSGTLEPRGPEYHPGTENIYLPSASAAESAFLVAHESMHPLIELRNASLDSDYSFDSVARAINEGYADVNGALFTADSDWVVNDDWIGPGSGARDLSESRTIADHVATGSAHENGRIVGHAYYRLATISGGSAALAKEILVKSIEELHKDNDGDGSDWSYEDVKLAMISAAGGNQSKENVIEQAWSSIINPGSANPHPLSTQFDYDFEVRTGDFDGNGYHDILIDRLTPGAVDGSIQTTVLAQNAGGFAAEIPSPSELSTARSFPINSNIELRQTDLNFDGYADIIVEALQTLSQFPTLDDPHIMYASATNGIAAPQHNSAMDDNLRGFFGDLKGWFGNPNYFNENLSVTVDPVFGIAYVCNWFYWSIYPDSGCFWQVFIVGYNVIVEGPAFTFDALDAASYTQAIVDTKEYPMGTNWWELSKVFFSVTGVHAFGFAADGSRQQTNGDFENGIDEAIDLLARMHFIIMGSRRLGRTHIRRNEQGL